MSEIIVGQDDIPLANNLQLSLPDVIISNTETYLLHIDYFFEKHLSGIIESILSNDAERDEMHQMIHNHANLILKLIPYQFVLCKYAAGDKQANSNTAATYGEELSLLNQRLIDSYEDWKQRNGIQ